MSDSPVNNSNFTGSRRDFLKVAGMATGVVGVLSSGGCTTKPGQSEYSAELSPEEEEILKISQEYEDLYSIALLKNRRN